MRIGNNVLIVPNVQIYTGTHSTRLSERLVAEEIDGDFSLVVRHPDGRRETVSSGEVSVRGLLGYV